MSKFQDYAEELEESIDKNLPKYDVVNGIKIINVMDLDHFLIGSKYDIPKADDDAKKMQHNARKEHNEAKKTGGVVGVPSNKYAKEMSMMKEWIKDNDALYYGHPHIGFNITDAVKDAQAQGKKIIIADDMS